MKTSEKTQHESLLGFSEYIIDSISSLRTHNDLLNQDVVWKERLIRLQKEAISFKNYLENLDIANNE